MPWSFLTSNDRKKIQFENFFNPKKGLEGLHDEFPDNESIIIIGQHMDLTIVSTPQGQFMYWKGLEPS